MAAGGGCRLRELLGGCDKLQAALISKCCRKLRGAKLPPRMQLREGSIVLCLGQGAAEGQRSPAAAAALHAGRQAVKGACYIVQGKALPFWQGGGLSCTAG